MNSTNSPIRRRNCVRLVLIALGMWVALSIQACGTREPAVYPLFTGEIEPADGAVIRSTEAWVRWRSDGTKGRVVWHKVGETEFSPVDAAPGDPLLARLVGLKFGEKYEYMVEQSIDGMVHRSSLRNFTVQEGFAFESAMVEQTIKRDYDQTVILTVNNSSKEKITVAARALSQFDDLLVDIVGLGSMDIPAEIAPAGKLQLRLAVTAPDATRATYDIPVEAAGAFAVARVHIDQPKLNLSFQVIEENPRTLAKTIEVRNEGATLGDLAVSIVPPNDGEVLISPSVNHALLAERQTLRVVATPVLYLEFQSLKVELQGNAAGQTVLFPLEFKAPLGQRLIGVRTATWWQTISRDWYCTNKPKTCSDLPGPPVNGPVVASPADISIPEPGKCDEKGDGDPSKDDPVDPCSVTGSIVDIRNHTLGESVRVTDTPFSLVYSSDRVPGRRAAYTLNIPVSGAMLPPGLKTIELEIEVGGKRFAESFQPKSLQQHIFTWDGKDASGRPTQGAHAIKVRKRYVFEQADAANSKQSKWQEWNDSLGIWDARTRGLGGWSLNVNHAYDPGGQMMYHGAGGRRIIKNPKEVSGELMIPSDDGLQFFVFDREGRHIRTVNTLTGVRIYQFQYDADGRLTTIEDQNGNATRIERKAQGIPTAIVAPYGQRTTLGVNADGYLESISNPARETVQLRYSADGLLAAFTDPNGNASRFTYDALGRLSKDESPDGGFSALTGVRTKEGVRDSLTTALGRNANYRVERVSNGEERHENTDPGGAQVSMNVSANGTRTARYPDGSVITILQQPDPRWGMQAPLLKHSTMTMPSGLTSKVSLNRTVTLADPNNAFSLTTQADTLLINGRKYTITFDVAKKQIASNTPAGRQSVTSVDNKGRIVKAELPGLLPVGFTYDDRGRMTKITQGDGAQSRSMSVSYNADGRIASTTDPLKRTVRLEYDQAGRVSKQILQDGREIRYTYDANGNRTSVMPPGQPLHTFEYSPVNLVKAYVPPKLGEGSTGTKYSYNADRELTHIVRPDGSSLDFIYDTGGRVSEVILPNGKLVASFDPKTQQLKTLTAADGGALSYTYDGALPTSTTWTGAIKGGISRSFDNNFRVTSVKVNDSQAVNFKYDLDGLLTQAGGLTLERDPRNGTITGTKLSNLKTKQEYNGFGERKRFSAAFDKKEIFAVEYERDATGRITKIAETLDGRSNIYAYAYDLSGRLIEVNNNGTRISHYEYDANGNRLAYKGPNGTLKGTYDDQDRVTQYGKTSHSHTANGELSSKTVDGKSTSYDYDTFGNLKSVMLPDGTKIEYVIDGQNRRIGKKVNGKIVQGFLYQDQLKPIAELDGHNNTVSRFIYSTKLNVPDYMEKGESTYRIITDHVGSPRLVIDVDKGTIAQRMDYDEFGNVLQDTNPGFQPFGYASGLYDQHTSLVRFGSRDYDAYSGRWTTKDPLGFHVSNTNLYGYVGNNPINWIDPWGLFEYTATAGDPVDDTTKTATDCFEKCSGLKIIVTAGKEGGHSKGSPHEAGQACDIGKKSNPDLTRETAKKCFEECFDAKSSYGQEESDHYHYQTRPGKGGKTGFAEGVK